MTRIRIKRVYEAPAPDDGCRVLVDRLWPRGVRRDALHCDVWARDLAPSAGLRSWYHADPGDRWEEFRRRYTDELRASQAVREFVRGIEGADTVTLLYASKNAAENHALILQEYLQRAAEGLQPRDLRDFRLALPRQRLEDDDFGLVGFGAGRRGLRRADEAVVGSRHDLRGDALRGVAYAGHAGRRPAEQFAIGRFEGPLSGIAAAQNRFFLLLFGPFFRTSACGQQHGRKCCNR